MVLDTVIVFVNLCQCISKMCSFLVDNESCASNDSYVTLSPTKNGTTVSPRYGKVNTMHKGLNRFTRLRLFE